MILRGYGSEGSLIKELVQNAEDAGAKHLEFILASDFPRQRTHSCVARDYVLFNALLPARKP